MHRIAIVGCGVIGLTSAVAIQNRLKNIPVTIFTKDVTPNTTSDIAAGLWEPYLLQDTPEEKIYQWARATLDYLLKLWKEGRAFEAGISLQPVINLSDKKDYKLPDWVTITLGHCELSRDHLVNLSKQYGRNFTGGFSFTSFVWEGQHLLPFLQKEFINNGGRIVLQEIKDFGELADYDVIVNCTGLESRNVAGDTRVNPIRGQISRVHAPWQFHTYLLDSEEICYIIPNIRSVILGGTKQVCFNLEVDETDKEDIFRKCTQLLPAIKSARIIKHQVGLRPGRDKVRLETEIKGGEKNGVRIVHNYGHGGAGITLSVGCAEEVAGLVEQLLYQQGCRSKL